MKPDTGHHRAQNIHRGPRLSERQGDSLPKRRICSVQKGLHWAETKALIGDQGRGTWRSTVVHQKVEVDQIWIDRTMISVFQSGNTSSVIMCCINVPKSFHHISPPVFIYFRANGYCFNRLFKFFNSSSSYSQFAGVLLLLLLLYSSVQSLIPSAFI